jgi:hypothetical protein
MRRRRIRLRPGEVKPVPNPYPVVKWSGKHYDAFKYDDLISEESGIFGKGISYSNCQAQQNINLTLQSLLDLYERLFGIEHTRFRSEFKADMELYKNVIETEYGVKLCVRDNHDSDFTTMEILVPNKLFTAENGRAKLANALAAIAQFIMNMDDPEL